MSYLSTKPVEKSSAQFANSRGGLLFFIWKMMRRSFRWLKKSPKPFWIPRNKIVPKKSSFGTPTLSCHTNQPHRHQPISNPCRRRVAVITGFLPLQVTSHFQSIQVQVRKAQETHGRGPDFAKAKKDTVLLLKGWCEKSTKTRGERGERLMSDEISDDVSRYFWWFLMIPDDFLMIFSWFLIIFRFKNDFPIVDLDFIYQATCRWRATFLVWSAPPTSTCTVWNWQNLTQLKYYRDDNNIPSRKRTYIAPETLGLGLVQMSFLWGPWPPTRCYLDVPGS